MLRSAVFCIIPAQKRKTLPWFRCFIKIKGVNVIVRKGIQMFELKLPVRQAICTEHPVRVDPRYVYEDGKKTDKQEKKDGKPVWRVHGIAPLVEVGDSRVLDTDATAVIASETEPDFADVFTVGELTSVNGSFTVTQAKFGSVTGRLDLESAGDDEETPFSTSAPRHGELED